jgi:hypothetical protein
MRIKSHWFKDDKPKSVEQVAGAVAFIVWRVAQNALKRMRVAQFDIDPGPQYFSFSSEFLVFLVMVADRIAYQRMEASERIAFTTALATRLGEILEDNQTDLLGPAADRSYRSQFISLFNERSPDYADFGYTAEGPDFGFLRYLGNRLLDIMVEKDQSWVVSQVMESEAPDAADMIRKSMADLLETGPRPSRARRVRVSGD